MRRLPPPRRMAVAAVVAVAVTALGAVLAMPHAAQAASAHGAQRAHPVATATTVADVTATSGGLCSVPGIGDIGGLLGFCALGSSGLTGELNNICQPSLPAAEPANGGIDAMIAPPASGKQPSTLYDQYGVAGDYWAATNLQCSDMTSLIGNNVAGMVFDAAKSLDRVTITVYQSAAGEGILGWLQRVTDKLITSLGNAIYFPYLAVVVILGAIWLAWQGLIRKRGTRTIEGTIWMIVACAAALFLIGKPADVTGLGRGVSDGISQALNVAFAKLPSPGPSSCVPVQKGDPDVQPSSYSYTSGSTVVDQNADELWTVLVCKPWLVGEFGTSAYSTGSGKPTLVNTYGRSLLWAQAIAVNEKPTSALIQAKQAAYAGIASSIKANDPSIYPLFQGNEWTTRLEVAFAALFAAVVAGVLVLLIAVTLILLKLSFLLLLIVGPFFLLIGVHPGFGRVVALRWVEMLIGVLLKQAAVALVLSLLLYCYALIMGASDAVLPWALKILMIALVTVAAFIYRRPFQHLFSAVGYGVIGSQERAEVDLARAAATARTNTVNAATAALPGFAAYRAGRWARRNPGQAASLAMAAASGGAAASVAAGLQPGEAGADGTARANGAATGAPAAGAQASASADGASSRLASAARGRGAAGTTGAAGAAPAEPPPLNLPSRAGRVSSAGGSGSGGSASAGSASAGSGSAGSGSGGLASAGWARPAPAWPGAARSGASSTGTPASGPAHSTGAGAGVPAPAPGAWPLGRGTSGAAPASGSRAPAGAGAAGAGPAAPAASGPVAAPPPSSRPARAKPAPRQSAPRQSVPRQSAPRQVPPQQPSQRQAGQRQAGQRQAGQRQASARQPAQRQPSNGSGSTRQSSGGRPAGGQGSLGSRLRARWSDSVTPPRQAPGQRGAGRQAQPRQPNPAGRGQPVSGPGAPERQALGDGRPEGGPLAGPAVEQDRPGPFWLRPVRRK
ncbi:MAG TPA: type IV secretion system protein [Streptosporangiaceae bacterium]|nr:type IV secretion system protein [Streptosporangiaceae bacterium]